jgi:hypothetical protein
VTVRVEKEGFAPREVIVGWHRSGAVWTNIVGVTAGGLGTVLSTACISWGGRECHRDANLTPLLVGAALTAAGTAVDLSTTRALSLDRDELVLRLEPVRLAEAPKGEPR